MLPFYFHELAQTMYKKGKRRKGGREEGTKKGKESGPEIQNIFKMSKGLSHFK